MAAWDRQHGETYLCYSRFLVYRDLGLDVRSIAQVAQIAGVTVKRLHVVAQRWNWVERADRWDAFILSIRDKAAVEEAEAIGRENVRVLRKLLMVGEQGLQRIADDEERLARLTLREITQAIRVGSSGLRAEGMLRNGRTDPQIEDMRLVIESLPAQIRLPLLDALEDFAREGEGPEVGSGVPGAGDWADEDE